LIELSREGNKAYRRPDLGQGHEDGGIPRVTSVKENDWRFHLKVHATPPLTERRLSTFTLSGKRLIKTLWRGNVN
jgi:hypothetical protein